MSKIIYDRLDWQPYLRALADQFGLKDWEIVVLDELPGDDRNRAEIACVYGQKFAAVRLSDQFLRDNLHPEYQRRTVVHELIHCHFAVSDHVARKNLTTAVHNAYEQGAEYGVDAIARAIAPLFPLPDEILKPKPKKGKNEKTQIHTDTERETPPRDQAG